MSITTAFDNAYDRKRKRRWDSIYVFIDIHDTIFKSTYGEDETFKYYPYAKNALRMLSKKEDIILGIYTSSYPKDIAKYLDKFEEDGIHFELINENPLEKNTKYACFDKKPYFNVLLDDKAGFDPYVDWYIIFKYFQKEALIELMRNDEELGLYDEKPDGYWTE